MNRTGWLAVLLLGLLGVGIGLRQAWPRPQGDLDCPPSSLRTFTREGYAWVACARDGGGEPLSASASWTMGRKLKLNEATEEELALLPGVGPRLARTLVKTREERGSFKSWDEVDAVAGVGPAKLKTLQAALEL